MQVTFQQRPEWWEGGRGNGTCKGPGNIYLQMLNPRSDSSMTNGLRSSYMDMETGWERWKDCLKATQLNTGWEMTRTFNTEEQGSWKPSPSASNSSPCSDRMPPKHLSTPSTCLPLGWSQQPPFLPPRSIHLNLSVAPHSHGIKYRLYKLSDQRIIIQQWQSADWKGA